jgi:hypothetical protein
MGSLRSWRLGESKLHFSRHGNGNGSALFPFLLHLTRRIYKGSLLDLFFISSGTAISFYVAALTLCNYNGNTLRMEGS